MKLRNFLMIGSFFSVSLFAAEQGGQTIRGSVVDAFTGSPVVGATVVVNETDPLTGSVSNDKGEFVIPGIQPGRWSFTASSLGYNVQSFNQVMVISGKETSLTFKLEEKVNELKDVIVKTSLSKEKSLNEMALVSSRTFSVEETERFAGSLGDPARMVSAFAGVVVGNDSRNDIIIRGNSPMGLLWRIDGVDVPNPNHFGSQGSTGGPVSMLNNNLLTNSDFMTGAFPAEYGNALSGVFDLNVRSGNREKYEFTGQIGFNGFEAAVEGPLRFSKKAPKGSFLLDYRYSTLQLVSKMGLDLDMGTGTAIPEYNDLTMIVDLPTRKLGRFRFFGLYGNSFIRLNRSFDVNESSTHSQMGYATDFGASLNVSILSHTLMLSEKTKLKSTLSWQLSGSTILNDTIDYVNKNYIADYTGDMGERMGVASTSLRHKFSASDFLTAGISVKQLSTSFKDSARIRGSEQYLLLTKTENEPSLYMQSHVGWLHKFSDQLSVNAGLHHIFYNLNNESSLEPRTALQWQIDKHHMLSLGYGLHSQMQPRSVYFYKEYDENTNTYSEKNRNLQFSKSNQLVLGYNWFSGKDFRIKSELYYQHLYKVPVSTSAGEFSMLNAGSGYYIERYNGLVNEGKGRNYGAELTVEKFLSKGYYMMLTLSLYDSKYQGHDRIWRNTAFNSNFAANLLTGYEWKIGKNNYLTFDVRTVCSGGMRYIPIDLDASIAAGEQVFDYSKAYVNKYKNYFRADLRIGYKQNHGKYSQEWGLDLQNVTNHQNLYAEQYNPTLKETGIIYQQGFAPMMLYRINF